MFLIFYEKKNEKEEITPDHTKKYILKWQIERKKRALISLYL